MPTDLWELCAKVPKRALREKAEPIESWGPEQEALARQMVGLVGRQPDGALGLAAPQIGEGVSLIVCSLPKQGLTVMANPRLTASVELTKQIDGRLRIRRVERCYSLGKEKEVRTDRASLIQVAFDHVKLGMRDSRIEPAEWVLEGQPACIVQHEIDHLAGTLITDRACNGRSSDG